MNHLRKAGLCLSAALAAGTTVVSAEPAERDVLRMAQPGCIHFDGVLGEQLARCIDHRVMAQDIDRLIEPFQAQEERDYGGFRCEYWGKWFTSAALAYAYQPTEPHRAVLDEAVRKLVATQGDDGYIGSYLPEVQLEGWDIWGKKYVLHGLLAHHEMTEDKTALRAAQGVLDHFIRQLEERHINIAETGFPDWVGLPSTSILEPVVLLYQRTGEPRYLEFAETILESWRTPNELSPSGLRLIEQALRDVSPADMGASKAYEMMSCFEGLCELYRATGERQYLEAARKLGEGVVDTERMVTGSGSNHELWCHGARYQTELLEQPVETCVTATWMKLCCQLLRLTGDANWADELEVSLYNALLGSMMPEGNWWSYYGPLAGERVPSHPQHPDVGLSCCVASGPRALLLTPRWAVMSSDEGPVVNLYAAGGAEVTLADGSLVRIEQKTDYPATGAVNITVHPSAACEFTLKLRIPAWSEATKLTVNDEAMSCAAGRYATIRRTWTPGDQVALNLDMRGRAISAPSGAPQFAIMRGPIVLALDSRLTPPRDTAAWLKVDADGRVDLTPARADAPDIRMAFEAPFEVRPSHVFGHHEIRLTMCDYASAGNQWSPENRFRVWLPQPLFLREMYPGETWRIMYPETDERPVVPAAAMP